jgi:hypothetical protein
MHAPFPLVTRRPATAGPRQDAWDLSDAWFERPRLSPVGPTLERSARPPRQSGRGLRFAVVSLGLVVASIAATAFVVAPHAKEITSVPAARVARPIQLAPIVEAAITEGEAYAATPAAAAPADVIPEPAVVPKTAAPRAVLPKPPPVEETAFDPFATPAAAEPVTPVRRAPTRKVPDVHFR